MSKQTFRRAPVAHAVAIALAMAGLAGNAHAQRAFSAAWMAQKNVAQGTAAATGYLPNGTPASMLTNPLAQQQKANEQLQRSIGNLNLAAQAIAAQQAAQAAARLAAQNGGTDVPDGLVEGGLKVDTNSLTAGWHNANAPTPGTAAGRTTVTVQQTGDKAILNWETFNVGRNTTVEFRQQADWAVLNRVNDPAARPSQIRGQIKGDGTVLIANRNGVVFSGSSQVDTRNLVAAAASIKDSQFTTGGIYSNGTAPSFTTLKEDLGKVEVQAGARITTKEPGSVTQGGGYVLLLGKEVSNAGEIATRKGQTQMAAGDSFLIRKGIGTDGNTFSTTRGNEVAPQFVPDSTAGKVSNTGLITAREGDITLAGRDVRQDGVAVASSTVSARGTVHLLNSAADKLGNVSMGKGAVTAVVIEDDGKASALDSQRDALIKESAAQDVLRTAAASGAFDNLANLADRRDQSRIEIVSGGDIRFEGESLTLATGGQIAASAARRSFVADKARLDVSGAVGVNVAMESNNVKVNVQGNELRDSPSNRESGKLFNNDVWIDRRNLVRVAPGVGGYEGERWYAAGGLLEVGGYLGNQGHGIGEWATQGGTVLLGGKEVVTQAGSSVNLSGGTLNVQTGFINQTWLKGSDGRLYSLNKAPSDMVFEGVYKGFEAEHVRWGKKNTEYFYNPLIGPQRLLENGYTVGRDAGRLVVSAPTAVLEGDIVADVFNGARQTRARDAIEDGYKQAQTAVARGGALAVGRYASQGRIDLFDTDVRFGDIAQATLQMAASDALGTERIGTLWLDSGHLNGQHLAVLDIGTLGTVKIDKAVTLADGGQMSLLGAFIDIGATVTTRGGKFSAGNVFQSTLNGAPARALVKDAASSITLRDGAALDLRGRRTDTVATPEDAATLAYLDGGMARIESTHGVMIEKGSLIDVSSGAALLAKGKQKGGKGGSVALVADSAATATDAQGVLSLGGEIRGHGVSGGGMLQIETGNAIVIGADPAAQDATALVLDASRLQSGFSAYDINGHKGLSVAPGAQVDVAMPVYQIAPYATAGNEGGFALQLWTPPLLQQDVPNRQVVQRQGADLVLRAQRRVSEGGDVAIGAGSVVSVDPGRSIRLLGGGKSSFVVDGRLNAWGGSIAIDIEAPDFTSSLSTSNQAHNRSVWIGEGAVLDVAARAQTGTDASGRRYGTVRNGGTISIGGALDWEARGAAKAPDLALVIRPGAVLDASGSSAIIDAPVDGRWREMNVASNGGSIVLKSAHSLYLDGTLRARAGGANAAGGTLAVALEAPVFSTIYPVDNEIRQARELILSQTQQPSGLPSTLKPGQADAALAYGKGRLGVDQVQAGGFGNLSLLVNGLLSFDGNVDLSTAQSLRIYAGSFALAESAATDSQVRLASSYLRLAGVTAVPQRDNEALYTTTWRHGASTRSSDAVFTAEADQIDVRDRVGFGAHGEIAMKAGPAQVVDRRGFDKVNVTSRGDVRMLGGASGAFGLRGATTTELATMGDLTITAAQIYPATGANAQIVAGYDKGRVLDIRRQVEGDVAMPQSAFGILALGGDTVRQGGIVRAPLGNLIVGQDGRGSSEAHASLVELLPGSITSVSGTGLLMPYGGTTDGIGYSYAGKPVVGRSLGTSGITITSDSVVGREGALLDLSGGGELTGAGFVTGRGGSVDVLRTPLANANPANTFSKAGNGVYAIVPGFQGGYAPVSPDAGASEPAIGRQITLDRDVAGLKAGTYTLLPSTYALQPGAFRVELGAESALPTAPLSVGNGSYVASGYLGVANTALKSSLASQLVVTPAAAVKQNATYNPMGYDAFVVADTARRGGVRGEIAADSRNLLLDYFYVRPKDGVSMLQFDGKALFNPAAGSAGFGGTLSVRAFGVEVLAPGAARTPDFVGVSLQADQLNAFGAPRLIVGGGIELNYADNFATFKPDAGSVFVRSGATLRGAEIFLLASGYGDGINLEQGASLNTLGKGAPAYDSTDGVVFSAGRGAVLGLSNGWINLLPPTLDGSPSTIQIGNCPTVACTGNTTLYGEGTLAVATNRSFTLADNVRYGAKNLVLAVSSVNLGSDAALQQAAANHQLPLGLSMNQGILANLLAGNKGEGVPAVETLVLNVRESVNIYGAVSLDTLNPATGVSSIARLVLGTPAIYGYGGAGDTAKITTGEFIWTGLTPTPTGTNESFPGANTPGSAIGSLLGAGTLDVSAARIVLGHGPNTQPDAGFSADRLALGFAAVNLNATERITANDKGTLGVYQRQGDYVAGKGYDFSGGNLNLRAPLVTGEAGSSNHITAGGDILVSALAGGAMPAGDRTLGAELALAGRNITIDGTVGLASGKLQLTAAGDVTLGANSRIDLSGQAMKFFEQTRYSRGGDLLVSSTAGNITQAAGSVIDLSATHNRGGTMQATALGAGAGRIDLGGRILGTASGSYDAGGTVVPYDAAEINVRGQSVADFAGLNARLNEGGVFGARRFQIKQGDLAIGDEVKARQVEVVVDGGNLTVNGRIDASGFQVGSIRLAAKGDLTVNGTLDAHGTGLRVDSYGKIIDSPNRAIVDLTSTQGTLTLGSGASIDLRAGTGVSAAQGNDGVPRGTLALNAPRRGEDDVAVSVNGTPAIQGAKSIAVNAFRTYSDAPPADAPDVSGRKPQLITQKFLDDIDADSSAFIDKALGNASLSARLAGLGSYHLRPGVEIVSKTADGDLSVVGDIDLSNYRYGPGVDRNDPARRGFGEPGVLVIRAGGNLNIYGSINDGFAPPPATPDDKGWYLSEQRTKYGLPFTPFGGDIVVPIDGVVLDKGTVFPKDAVLNYDVPAAAVLLPGGTVLPVDVTLGAAYTLPAGTVLRADVYNTNGTVRLKAGTVLGEAVVLDSGMKLGAGTALRGEASVQALVWPKGVRLPVALKADSTIALPRGALIPSMTVVELPNDEAVNLRPVVDGIQGRNWAVAPMLGQGASSWSLQLTAGADLDSADRRAVDPAKHASIILADSHAMTNIKTVSGGTGLVWGPAGPANGFDEGTPVEDWVIDAGYCDFLGPDACLVDPVRIVKKWGPGGIKLDPSFKEGELVPEKELFRCDSGDVALCVSFINPVKDVIKYTPLSPMFSVVRTGTGDLGAAAAGNFVMESPFGFYTAGTRSAPLLDANGLDPFNLARGKTIDGSVIGPQANDYGAALAAYQAWYPEHGGNVDIAVRGNVLGDVWGTFGEDRAQIPSASVGNWLWRQGSGTALAGSDNIATAWWINFGAYALPPLNRFSEGTTEPYLAGFTGMGTLGGGNLTLRADGNAGTSVRLGNGQQWARSEAIVAAVGSTGRVDANGKITLTGGGDLQLRIGGAINPNLAAAQYATYGNNSQYLDLNGALVNLRGMSAVSAGAIGGIELKYRKAVRAIPGQEGDAGDTRPIDPFTATIGIGNAGIVLVPGDSAMYLDTPGDLVMASVVDPGRALVPNASDFKLGSKEYNLGQSWFSLWTGRTAINLFSAGGNLTPGTDLANIRPGSGDFGSVNVSDTAVVYPSILRATAASGSLYYGFSAATGAQAAGNALVLAPSPSGELEFLAGTSLFGGGYPVSMSGAVTPLPTPLAPAFVGYDAFQRPVVYNTSSEGSVGAGERIPVYGMLNSFPLFAFGPDTLGSKTLHPADAPPTLFYAVKGDILGLASGTARKVTASGIPTVDTWNRSAAPARIRAGRDIVGTDALIVNNDPRDVSLIQAGRDILYANVRVAGPGALEMSAGRHITQDDRASVVSQGALAEGDSRPGASISMMAGMGANGPDFSAMAERYLDPAKRAETGAGQSLASQPDRVVKTYEVELAAWLAERYGFAATSKDAKDPGSAQAYFRTLAPEQQRVFLRTVYFAELRAGGREYNDENGPRYGSYLRGRGMIATLFPDLDAAGQEIVRKGDIIMYGPSGVHTDFGGDIQMLAPGGQIVVGVQGAVPPGSAGVITQGMGNIQLFSEGSLLLGLSRVMTTFGGDVLAWSEKGDINAGRGSKTTLVYTPPKRVYDNVGNVKLSSQVPSSGAGLATLAPIPEVPAGDMDLIAPLGTIDAGEAGIRVSGNVNLAALQVVNAANIQVKGESAGLPVVAAVNVGALTNASAAASQATAAAQDAMQRERAAARQSLPSVFTVRVLGFGNEGAGEGAAAPEPHGAAATKVGYDVNSPVQVLGRGPLGEAQKAKLTPQERRLLGQ
ncbi:filamentous haemagglutinin family protein [Variovorax sp. PAMC26660]|uniref:filamentous haemagglutinin family protein n=1 Tax=Variovorax sp. PAMC26660 TaxID=2762322 RepID=UPI00164D71A9|nr:filamentous haemagglutinin family protein [Variovorax sp. PAMC26660]QNK66562.1 filamentous hemagglutinin family protein [Variovorax sp. PAMC26660]